MNNLKKYLDDNYIKYEIVSDNILSISGETYQLIYPDNNGRIFDDVFELTCSDTDEDNYIFEFGDKYYWTPKGTETNPQLNPLKYIGEADIQPPHIPWLGVHGKYEILNGSREYSDWCVKAKFMGSKYLGICELNTLAGTILFQEQCIKNDIRSIIGATYVVRNIDKDIKYRIKIYAKDDDGWQTLLRINKSVNVDNDGFADESYFWNNLKNVVIVIDPKYCEFDYIKSLNINRKDVYYQFDTVRYDNKDSDREYLSNLGKFILSDIEPILIQDSYYLDKADSHIKAKLNIISGIREFRSNNQYMKSFDDIYIEADEIFSRDSEMFERLLEQSIKNLINTCKQCDFKIDTDNFYLPDYKLTEEQLKKYKDKNDLIYDLIEKGLKNKVPQDKIQIYRDRIDKELSVINMGDKLVDYFLILWDIIEWCHKNDILVGVGRGSSAGCLIAYLLDIVQVDPIKYNLLFERFLNENRVKKSLPDIDSDFEGLRRDDIKEYMEYRFGKDNVCSVGTYANMKMKMAVYDLSRIENLEVGTIRMMTSIMDDLDNDGANWSDIFRLSTQSNKLKTFVKKNSHIINDCQLILMQPRSSSVHACATIITPDDKSIFEWIPIKRMKNKKDEDILVSEWEGFYLDSAGFLKEDILGILQLDKFAFIRRLIKENKSIDINIYEIDLEDNKTFRYFHNGWNEDVFQFGTRGLKQYSKEVKPDSIEELTAMNALYRPGAMKSNAHKDYVDIKFGKKDPDYDYMLEDVTKNTYGLYLYQEQTMLAAQKLGNMSLSEADMMRKVMLGRGKKQQADKFYIYMNKFIEGAIKNGCGKEEASIIWDKLEAFAGYGFNRSHAVSYALTGYISQYLKVHYPIEFWTCAFSFIPSGKKDEKIPAYISEIHQSGDIKMLPPDINKSGDGFTPDFKTNSIYWSLNSVKQCGDKAVEQLVNDKKEKGEYFSFDEFLTRNVYKGSKVTKQVVENLILSGAFDEIENLRDYRERLRLIEAYRNSYKVKIDESKDLITQNKQLLQYNWWWSMQQKKICGFALFDFELICENYLENNNPYLDATLFQDEENEGRYVSVGGYINEINVKISKKGEYAEVVLDNNFEFIVVKFWQDAWDVAKRIVEDKEKSIMLIDGKLMYDRYKKINVLNVNENSDILILE